MELDCYFLKGWQVLCLLDFKVDSAYKIKVFHKIELIIIPHLDVQVETPEETKQDDWDQHGGEERVNLRG